MTNQTKIIVFVDTSYLSRLPREDTSSWQRLLLQAKEGKIQINISLIAAEEYRSQHRDDLTAEIDRTERQLKNLRRKWGANPVAQVLGDLPDIIVFPTQDAIDLKSYEIIEILKSSNVSIVEPQPHHIVNTWKNYFSWAKPFKDTALNERDDPKIRDNRRKDIPDAWIYEAAIDMLAPDCMVHVLCNDGNLAAALKEQKLDTYTSAADILAKLQQQSQSDAVAGAAPQPAATAAEPTSSVTLISAIEAVQEKEKDLQIRILGYVSWFAPLAKADLLTFMQKQNYEAKIVDNVAIRLTLNGLIIDTGGHYLPKNKAVCDKAAELIMPELTEVLKGL